MEAWRVGRPVVADLCYFDEEQDLDPEMQSKKSDPGSHQSEKKDPDPHIGDAAPQHCFPLSNHEPDQHPLPRHRDRSLLITWVLYASIPALRKSNLHTQAQYRYQY
jgi:hypothetical protein